MSVIRVGSNGNYAENWNKVFDKNAAVKAKPGKAKAAPKKAGKKAAPKAAASNVAKPVAKLVAPKAVKPAAKIAVKKAAKPAAKAAPKAAAKPAAKKAVKKASKRREIVAGWPDPRIVAVCRKQVCLVGSVRRERGACWLRPVTCPARGHGPRPSQQRRSTRRARLAVPTRRAPRSSCRRGSTLGL